jgi:hypothetical protein
MADGIKEKVDGKGVSTLVSFHAFTRSFSHQVFSFLRVRIYTIDQAG